MVVFLTTAQHRYTIERYLELWGVSLEQQIRYLPYELFFCMGSLKRDTYIFTDLDRLSKSDFKRTTTWYNLLKKNGVSVLNNPSCFKGRLELLRILSHNGQNQFNAFPIEHAHLARFPVFLRYDCGHDGPESELIYDKENLDLSIKRIKKLRSRSDLIVVEYLDHREADERHYKYTHFRIGNDLIFGGMVCGKSWCLKGVEDMNQEIIHREQKEALNISHNESLMACFNAAGIEFGRIDYTVLNGKIQVFEINTNPDIGAACMPGLERWLVRSRCYQQFNEVLWGYIDNTTSDSRVLTPGKINIFSLFLITFWKPVLWVRKFRFHVRQTKASHYLTTLIQSWINR